MPFLPPPPAGNAVGWEEEEGDALGQGGSRQSFQAGGQHFVLLADTKMWQMQREANQTTKKEITPALHRQRGRRQFTELHQE